MYENMESMTPAAGNTMPSRLRHGCARGADIDSIFKQMDGEDILREVSKYPVQERKMLLKFLRQTARDRA